MKRCLAFLAPLLALAAQPGTPPVVARLQQQLSAEAAQLSQAKVEAQKAEKAAGYWKQLTDKEGQELKEVMQEEALATKQLSGGSAGDTTKARLTACIRTRDVIQMNVEKLQRENAKAHGQMVEALRVKDVTNSTLSKKIEATATDASKQQSEMKAKNEDLQKEAEKAHAETAELKASNEKLRIVKRDAETERENLRKQLADIKKIHAQAEKQNAVVVKEKNALKQAHEVLQKRHEELKNRASTVNATELKSENVKLRAESTKCAADLAKTSTSSKAVHEAEADMRLAALKQGEKEAEDKWAQKVKSMTSLKDLALRQAVKANETAVAEETKTGSALKARDETELKLRQCRASREKTELELRRVLERSGDKESEKSAFLQISKDDWADWH